jgi:hypothetical protein
MNERYQIITAHDTHALSRLVEDLLAKGWTLHGAPFIHGDMIGQALTKSGGTGGHI